jgi:hypothetical protein
MTIFVQTMSYMFTLPLYLILHIRTSPIAGLSLDTKISGSSLRIPSEHLAVLPFSFLIAYVVPTIGMFLPPNLITAQWHYLCIALWQPFPLWYFLVQTILADEVRKTNENVFSSSTAYLASLRRVYNFIIAFAAMFHLPIVFLALAPTTLRRSIASVVPILTPYLTSNGSLRSIFAPWSPFTPPTVNPATLQSGQLAPLAVCFLHYDIYLANGALLLWALYLHRNALGRTVSLLGVLARTVGWFAIAGHVGAIANLLWERDAGVERERVDGEREKKTQ